MRIALIHTALAGPSGGEKQVLQLAIYLQKLGHSVELFTNRAEKECFLKLQKKVKITTLKTSIEKIRKFKSERKGVISKLLGLFGEWSNLLVMRKIGKNIEEKFDLINCHNFPSEWAAYFAKKRLDIPIVWMCNEPPFFFFNAQLSKKMLNFPLYSFFDKIAVSKIDKIVVLDDLNRKRVKKIYHKDSEIIRSGLDINSLKASKFEVERIKKKHSIGKSFMLLSVGGFLDFKRQEDAIKACNLLVKKGLDVKLVIIGIGPLMDKCRELVISLGIKDKVIFAGRVFDKELSAYYNASDVVVFPAEQTWGLVIVEAMACRKVGIASDKSGVSEIIEDGKNGFVFESRNVEQMAEITERVMKDKQLYNKISNSGYGYVKKNLSWEKYARNMERVFKETLKSS